MIDLLLVGFSLGFYLLENILSINVVYNLIKIFRSF